ncbi:MAG: GNAT family N-acetyltransferase [Treponema sp.]|nr:GNAT family N-acetyltransferase [Candidatus Treponema caballi]
MKIDDITFTLKDGRKAVLRNARESDAQGLYDYLLKSAAETHFILREPEDCGAYSVEGEVGFINKSLENPFQLMLVCDVDGVIAGNCQIDFFGKIKLHHRANIGIALIKEYWGLGIGSKMFEAMIQAARDYGGITRINLDVAEENERALALYKKFGFEVMCRFPDAMMLKDGTYIAELKMTKKLD